MVTSNPSAAAAAMMSPHRDVLEATPETSESKARLVEELKSRGRAAVSAKSWMDAKLLYEKALAVVETMDDGNEDEQKSKTTAILASNLSLVELKMNHGDDAEVAARKATEADPKYLKSWWRLGQALIVTEKHDEALEALKKAQSLEPTNKALIKEVEKVQQTVDEIAIKKKKEEEEKKKADSDVEMKDGAPEVASSAVATPKLTTTTASSEKKGSATSTGASSDMRGYKIVNGKKTSYFHNELSDEAKELIGDIAPKKLDNPPPPTSTSAEPTKKGSTSAWNNAGTWEEKDCSVWAKESLTKALMETTYVLPPSSPAPNALVTVTKVKSCDGHASVAVARGKTRFIYEWCVKIEWHLGGGKDGDGLDCKGSLALPDIDGTIALGEGYEIHDFIVDSVSDNSVKPLVDRFVRRGGFHDVINESIDDWVRLFKKEYGPKL